MEYKVCNKCHRILPATDEFYFKHKHGLYGVESTCKECVKKRRKLRYKNSIYEIYCKDTDTYYIGQTIKPITERISKHFSDAKRGRKQPLYEDIRKFGKDAFNYKILEIVDTKEKLDEREKYYISLYKSNGKKMYNREGGGHKGLIVHEETKRIQAKSRGTNEFIIFDSDGFLIGEFYSYNQAYKELGWFKYKYYLDNLELNDKNYIILSKENFSEELLYNEIKAYRYLEDIYCDSIKEKEIKMPKSMKGENNPMYGKKGALNPNSKKVYVIKGDNIEIFESASEVSNKYKFQARAYARGVSNHYYKKLDMYIYYEYLLPLHIQSDKSTLEETNI